MMLFLLGLSDRCERRHIGRWHSAILRLEGVLFSR
jgi:hypothetical protein